jgi:drug/metabolite transporter (DMT)-like permease
MNPKTEAPPRDWRVPGALILVQVLFASLSVAGKLVLADLPPRALVAARVTVAALIFIAIRAIVGAPKRMPARDLAVTVVHAFFGIIANQLLFVEGLAHTTAINAIVVQSLIPVFTVAVAVVLKHEKPTLSKTVGLAIALCGVALLVGLDRVEGGHTLGNVLVTLNALSFSIYLVISRGIFERYGTVEVMTWTFIFGAVGVLPFGVLPFIENAHRVSLIGGWALTWIVIGPTVGTYFLNGWALRRAPASLVAVFIYVQPVIGALLAAAILGEIPGKSTVSGALLIALGITVVTRRLLQFRSV